MTAGLLLRVRVLPALMVCASVHAAPGSGPNSLQAVQYGTLLGDRIVNPSRTRLVIELDKPLAHDVSVRGNELWITLEPLPIGSTYDGLQF